MVFFFGEGVVYLKFRVVLSLFNRDNNNFKLYWFGKNTYTIKWIRMFEN